MLSYWRLRSDHITDGIELRVDNDDQELMWRER